MESSFFIGESKKFKVEFFLSNIESKNLHDLYPIKFTSGQSEPLHLIISLLCPLEDKYYPVFTSEFSEVECRYLLRKNFFKFEQGFVHARNYLQDHFFDDEKLDLVVFDHGLDQHPFPGGKLKFFRSHGNFFEEDKTVLDLPPSFYFGGISGDWDGDRCPELVVFDMSQSDPLFLKMETGRLILQEDRLPKLRKEFNFSLLGGTKYVGLDGRCHMALGSSGGTMDSPNDLFLLNQNNGVFRSEDVRFFPTRRGGSNWACVEMKNIRFKGDSEDLVLANYHSGKVQHGIIDIYKQRQNNHFEYFNENEAVLEEKDSWFYRLETLNLQGGSLLPDSIITLKSRGLENFVKKDFNFVLRKKVGDTFVDLTEELACLRDKEFMGMSKRYNPKTKVDDLIFFDNFGNHYYCHTKV